jgi:serine/threonine protein kinase/type II secretory pathway pseudopilin PulG
LIFLFWKKKFFENLKIMVSRLTGAWSFEDSAPPQQLEDDIGLSDSIRTRVQTPQAKLGNEITSLSMSGEKGRLRAHQLHGRFSAVLDKAVDQLTSVAGVAKQPFAIWAAVTRDLAHRAHQLSRVPWQTVAVAVQLLRRVVRAKRLQARLNEHYYRQQQRERRAQQQQRLKDDDEFLAAANSSSPQSTGSSSSSPLSLSPPSSSSPSSSSSSSSSSLSSSSSSRRRKSGTPTEFDESRKDASYLGRLSQFERRVWSYAALLLASKAEETLFSVSKFGRILEAENADHRRLIDGMCRREQDMLVLLGFDVVVPLPHLHLLRIADELDVGDDVLLDAIDFLHVSLFTSAVLYPPLALAVTALHLSVSRRRSSSSSSSSFQNDWVSQFHLTLADVVVIGERIVPAASALLCATDLSTPVGDVQAPSTVCVRAAQSCRGRYDFEKLEMVNKGTFGTVWRARDIKSNDIVALKKIHGTASRSGFPYYMLREVLYLLRLQHPHIIRGFDMAYKQKTGGGGGGGSTGSSSPSSSSASSSASSSSSMPISIVGAVSPSTTSPSGSLAVPSRRPRSSSSIHLPEFYIVMEFVENDLLRVLQRQLRLEQAGGTDCRFTMGQVKSLMQQLLSSIRHMHSFNLMHRDIKCANLLLTSDGVLKVADLGSVRDADRRSLAMTVQVVTLWYRPPELLFQTSNYAPSVDLWSIGCLFYELLTYKPLFPGHDELDTIKRIIRVLGGPSRSVWTECFASLPLAEDSAVLRALQQHPTPQQSTEAMLPMLSAAGVDLFSSLLEWDPRKRITAQQALDHAFFSESPAPETPIPPPPTALGRATPDLVDDDDDDDDDNIVDDEEEEEGEDECDEEGVYQETEYDDAEGVEQQQPEEACVDDY